MPKRIPSIADIERLYHAKDRAYKRYATVLETCDGNSPEVRRGVVYNGQSCTHCGTGAKF